MLNPPFSRLLWMLVAAALLGATGCTSGQSWTRNPSSTAPVLDQEQQVELQLALGRTFEKQQQWTSARTVYSEVLRRYPQHSEAAHRLAIVYDRRGDSESAAHWFEQALQHDPSNADILCDMGYSHYRRDELAAAEANFRRALALDPQHGRARNQLGVVLARSGRRKESLSEFRKAGCTESEAHSNLAYALVVQEQLEEAAAELEIATQSGPASPEHRDRLKAVAGLIARAETSKSPGVEPRAVGGTSHSAEVRPVSLETKPPLPVGPHRPSAP